MKQYFTIFLFLLITAVYATEYLVSIDNLNDKKKDFTVIQQIDNHFIILADENDITALKRNNFAYRILDSNPGESDYYVVFPVGENSVFPDKDLSIDEPLFARYGDVLEVYEYCLIMRGNAEKIQQVPGYNIKLNYIELSPITYVTERPPQPVRSRVAPDPLIEEMIEAVSRDTCERLIRQMTGRIPVTIEEGGDTVSMYSRYCGNDETNKDILVPWLKKKFLEYGCDSVYEVPLLSSKYDAPAVVGIRIGEKNPSLKKFCVIGGHPDNVLKSGDNMGRIYGAHDNASGTVGTLEACRAMKNYTFENTILFCGFNAEERGLLGSKALAKYWRDNDFEVIGGVIAYDMIGCAPEGGYRISFNYSENVAGSEEFGKRIEEIIEIYETYTYRVKGTTGTMSTDCNSFWEEGYVSMGTFASSNGPTIHTLGDSIGSWYNFDHLAKVTQTGLTIIADYAVPITNTSIQNDHPRQMGNNRFRILNASTKRIVISFNGGNKNIPLTLNIRNVSGRAVKTLPLTRSEEGRYYVLWNGNDFQGKAIAGGLYILECITGTESMFKKILLMR